MNQKPITGKEIMRRLPHRYPFLMIDRIISSGNGEAVAIKNVTMNEPHFPGHFATEPIMPGVLIGESMAQTAAFISGDGDSDNAGSIGSKAFLSSINLKIERPVIPGDQLIITARLIKKFGKLMKITASAKVDGIEVASADITLALV